MVVYCAKSYRISTSKEISFDIRGANGIERQTNQVCQLQVRVHVPLDVFLDLVEGLLDRVVLRGVRREKDNHPVVAPEQIRGCLLVDGPVIKHDNRPIVREFLRVRKQEFFREHTPIFPVEIVRNCHVLHATQTHRGCRLKFLTTVVETCTCWSSPLLRAPVLSIATLVIERCLFHQQNTAGLMSIVRFPEGKEFRTLLSFHLARF